MHPNQEIDELKNQVKYLSNQMLEQEKQIKRLTRAMSSARQVFGNKGTFF